MFLCFRVECYFKFGWDEHLIDPDNGVNLQRKLLAEEPNSSHQHLLESVPKASVNYIAGSMICQMSFRHYVWLFGGASSVAENSSSPGRHC